LDDLDLPKRTIAIRRLKGSQDSSHYLERDEVAGLKALQRLYAAQGSGCSYLFVNERGQPFNRMGIARVIERAGTAAKLPFAVHVHMLRHSTGYALANRGMDTRRLQHFLGTPASPIRFAIPQCRQSRSRTFGDKCRASMLAPLPPESAEFCLP
jgi:type 1 fimbriae regulatory protein FimB/type 1 fimbriae regulatory protein FimE